MKYTCIYDILVTKKDIPRLDYPIRERIKAAIREKLETNPVLYGSPLHADLKSCWKFRVGDYRVGYMISGLEIRILAIAHRSKMYNLLQKRI